MRRCKISQDCVEEHKRNHSVNARGPRPQACDVCQLRKVKCSKDQPSCKSCIRLGYICSYRRVTLRDNTIIHFNGENKVPNLTRTIKPPRTILKLIRSLLSSSIINNQKSQVGIDLDGKYFYVGNSLGASYIASNASMLSKSNDLKIAPAQPVRKPQVLLGDIIQLCQTRQKEVVGLFFGYINTYFPVVHPPSFYSQMDRNSDDGFMALLSVVCLCGSSFYPDKAISQFLGELYAHQALKYLKRVYTQPSLSAIQACTLLAFQLNPVESDPIISNSWYYTGIARSMAIALGYHANSPVLSKVSNGMARRVLWLITINDILCSHITGRLGCIGVEVLNQLPSTNLPCASVNLESYDSIRIPELMGVQSVDSLHFFRCLCELSVLIGRLDVFNKKSKLRLRTSSNSNSNTNSNTNTNSNSNYFQFPNLDDLDMNTNHNNRPEVLKSIQEQAFKWYSRIYPFQSHERLPFRFQLPKPKDLLLGALSVYFFSFIIDLNRPFILPQHFLAGDDPRKRNLLLNAEEIDIDDFLSLNPLERCQVAAHLAFLTVYNCDGKLAEFCTPVFWYAILQVAFTALLVLDRCQFHPWAVDNARVTLTYLHELLTKNARHRAIVHDCLLMIQPFLAKYLSPSTPRI